MGISTYLVYLFLVTNYPLEHVVISVVCRTYIFKQLDGINKMFKDGDKRAIDPKLAVLTLVVPTGHGSYCVLHRCLWDLNTPLAMIDMYCEEILRDIGLGYVVAFEMAKYMKSVVETLRKSREHTISSSTRMGPDIIIPRAIANKESIRFPVVLKSIEDAERLKEALKDVDFGHEETALELSQKNCADDPMTME